MILMDELMILMDELIKLELIFFDEQGPGCSQESRGASALVRVIASARQCQCRLQMFLQKYNVA